jgi:hypothetical protein
VTPLRQPFFQNLLAVQVEYFTVNPDAGEGTVDWEWFAAKRQKKKADARGICGSRSR